MASGSGAKTAHDRLRALVADSEFARGLLRQIDDSGYAVLPGVFAAQEAEAEYGRMWSWVERVSSGVRRRDASTWRRRGGLDPWPCSQRDMMQLHQAGWVFSELRERMAERVFERLYGTRELHCSKDGFTLQRPTSGELGRTPNDHFDQGSASSGLQCIQGSVALTDQEHDDGCFLCWPGSHRHHATLMARRGPKGGRQDFVILNDAEKDFLQEQGIQPMRVPVRRGDVILWRSDLVHKGAPPIGRRDGFRGVVYVCMLPAVLTPEQVYADKRRAYQQLETGSHWPCREEWFAPKRDPSFCLRPYFSQPPQLTARQRLLYGLERYCTAAPTIVSQHVAAPSVEGPWAVVRVARRSAEERGLAKWTSPARPAADAICIESGGIEGDYNHYRTMQKGGTLDRAVSIMTLEALASLQRDGYGDLHAGDFGENVTLAAPEASLAAGMRLRTAAAPGGESGEGCPAVELELTERMVPCQNLEHLAAIAALHPHARRAFPSACRGRRGWYARVLVAGELRPGDALAPVLAPGAPGAPTLAASASSVAASGQSSSEAPPNGSSVGLGAARTRRWRQVPARTVAEAALGDGVDHWGSATAWPMPGTAVEAERIMQPVQCPGTGGAVDTATQPLGQEREARKLRKALREIEELEQRQAGGETLQRNQLWKVERKVDYALRLSQLGMAGGSASSASGLA